MLENRRPCGGGGLTHTVLLCCYYAERVK